MHRIDRSLVGLLSIAIVVGLLRLVAVPPLWWDEGWTLTVARNWVEQGHYGRMLDGEPTSAGLAAAFPVTAPIALSFRLLGVGVWQGRLVGVFFTLGALTLIYYLACRLYDRSVAIWTLAVLLLMSPIHPVIAGRQVLGEMPALFYLLAGYAFFLSALRKSPWFMPVAVAFWAVALNTKLQVLPFWIVSLFIPLLVTVFRRHWGVATFLLTGLLSSLIASRLLLWLQQLLLHGRTVPVSPIHGLYDITALVPALSVRFPALVVSVVVGLPVALGLCYAALKLIGNRNKTSLDVNLDVLRLALLALVGSWFAWYLLLSVGWPRYLFPATFIGSIFAAAMLHDLTDRFSLSSPISPSHSAHTHLRFTRRHASALLATVLIGLTFAVTMKALHQAYVVDADASVQQVAEFLNTQTGPHALIETYDSELFFLLNRRYHYPPDQTHVELIRRTLLRQDVSIDYDPLAADPDYLVVGPYSKVWQLYDAVLATGTFRLLRTYSRYDVYERVR